MAIGVIARVQVAPGKDAEFETIFSEQAAAVRESESGNRLYQLARCREDPTCYVVMELYEDEAAFEAHRSSKALAANRPRIAPLLAGRTTVEIYDAV